MPIETAEDRAAFVDPDDFGTEATYALATGGESLINGLFDKAAGERLDKPGIVSARPRFVCRDGDIPAGAGEGDTLAVGGTTYAIRVRLPDGTGMTELHLERIA
jgi:hypothetical protein